MAEIKEMMIEELEARKLAIKEEINQPEADLDALEEEARAINEELEARAKAEAEKVEARKEVAEGKDTKEIENLEERTEVKTMDLKEIRNSKEYIDAFANYIKTGDDKECRALLSELATGGSVPVPEFVYDEIMRAWETDEIMQRVRKSYIRGVVKVGFEASATDAVVHAEGSTTYPEEEVLTMGIVTLTPQSIKKWITISDEIYDMAGDKLLTYLYSEIAHKIAQKASELVIDAVLNAPESSTSTAVGLPNLEVTALGLTTIVEAIGALKGDVRNLVAVMNRSTYAQFRAVQASANYGMDIFEGLTIIFSDYLANYGTAGETFALVGDLDKVLVNFPNGENDITFKFDDLSLAEKDLVKIVGRMYAGIGVIAPDSFCKITFTE